MFNKIKENKGLKIVGNILYALLVILVLLILVVVILQRVSNNTISLGGFRIFNIITESMVPKYEVGDILVAKEIAPGEIKVGDDVVYQGKEGSFAGKTVTHQVIEIEEENGNYKFHTKGIANDEEDPLVGQEQISGKIVYKIKTISYISKVINNLYSFYFIIFIPIAILIFIEIRRTIMSLKKDKKEVVDKEDEEKKEKDEKSE